MWFWNGKETDLPFGSSTVVRTCSIAPPPGELFPAAVHWKAPPWLEPFKLFGGSLTCPSKSLQQDTALKLSFPDLSPFL